eukprot:9178930-Alexandrium_andersonii.AAC.1
MNKKGNKFTEGQILALADYHRELAKMRGDDRGPAATGAAAAPAVPAVGARTPIEEWSGTLPT